MINPFANGARGQTIEMVEDWLSLHQDPRDPLTLPVRLLLEMFVRSTSWRARILPVVIATVAGAVTNHLIEHGFREPTVVVRADEQAAFEQWIASGEASRLLRCESTGLAFKGGRCKPTDQAGWMIPFAAQLYLERIGKIQPVDAKSMEGARKEDAPWAR